MTAKNRPPIKPLNGGALDASVRSKSIHLADRGHRVLQAALGHTIKAIQWLAPAVCILCQQTHPSTEAICHDCDQRLPRNHPACPRCALPSAGMTSTTALNRCTGCQQHPLYFAETRAPFLMQAGIRGLIHLWKFEHQPQLSPLLASLFIREVFPTPPSPSSWLLAPIPTQRRRQVYRGFDHTRVLAQAISAAHTPLVNGQALVTSHLFWCHPASSQLFSALAQPTRALRGQHEGSGLSRGINRRCHDHECHR